MLVRTAAGERRKRVVEHKEDRKRQNEAKQLLKIKKRERKKKEFEDKEERKKRKKEDKQLLKIERERKIKKRDGQREIE